MFRGYFPHGKIACGVMNTVFLISLPSSVLSLTLLTAERLIAVLFPYKIRNILTKPTVGIAITSVWVYVFLVGLFPIMYNKEAVMVAHGNCYLMFPLQYNVFLVSVNFLLPIVFICGVNIVLLLIAQKHHRGQASISSRLISSSSSSHDSSQRAVKRIPQKKSLKVSNNLKAAKRIALLVGVFLVCWLSYIIIVASNFICWCNPQELTWIANVINYSCTAINPLLYGLLNKTIRREVCSKLRRDMKLFNLPRFFHKYEFLRSKLN